MGNLPKILWLFLLLLVSADLAFFALNLLLKLNYLTNPLFSIQKDGGYAEIYQYLKELWIILLLAILWLRVRQPVFIGWLLLWLYLLLDDSLQLHEQAGEWLAQPVTWEKWAGIGADAWGEFLYLSVVGAALVALLYWTHKRSASGSQRQVLPLWGLLVLLVFCGGIGDMLHSAFYDVPIWQVLFVLLEDGGEMVVVSLMVVALLALHLKPAGQFGAASEPEPTSPLKGTPD
ncbi:hypothetical protein [Ferrimonas gelatinilytica]|uniref:Uncharacterized protein n=1 Tax=Ferrimonas gelatinilytica TaxID=1255257 RepID=A0ABP9S0P2_9GAMM